MSNKKFLTKMFNYNKWANKQYREVLRNIHIDDLKLETKYGVLLDRIIHIFASYQMWHKRLQNESPTEVIKASEFNDWNELESTWIKMDDLLLDYVKSSTDDLLDQEVNYTSLDGRKFTRIRTDILFHLIQHPTYHRGQLSSIFKHSELPNLPATDVVLFLTAPDRD